VLRSDDPETAFAVRSLRDTVRCGKPLVLWIGAGASSWCGYPRWAEMADHFHSAFLTSEPTYDVGAAVAALDAPDLPQFFEICASASIQRYRRMLAGAFASKQADATYRRFLSATESLPIVRLVTTNVDETLEHNLRAVNTIQRADCIRVPEAVTKGENFLAKLHGSVSEIETVVFTANDYQRLVSDSAYIAVLDYLFKNCSVLFLGYGLQDEYVVGLLARAHDLNTLFGVGPHFAVLPSRKAALPRTVHQILYETELHGDHRSAIRVLEEVQYTAAIGRSAYTPVESQRVVKSAHFISDIYPVGIWTCSQTFRYGQETGHNFIAQVGHGIQATELPSPASTAMHDMIVGLLCFDQVYMPLRAAHRIYGLIGEQRFWHLIENEAFRFIHWDADEIIVFDDEPEFLHGSVGSAKNLRLQSVDQSIRAQMKATPGTENQAEVLFDRLKAATVPLLSTDLPVIPDLVRGLLLFPTIRSLLGMSDGISVTSIPHWLQFPVLRLAHVLRVGATCDRLHLRSTKLLFGAAELAGPALAAVQGVHWADEAASYVLCGNFNTDLGEVVMQQPTIVSAILAFRETPEGVSLRREVRDQLAVNEAGEFTMSINAGLRATVPFGILERARNQLTGLLIAEGYMSLQMPVIWNNRTYSDTALALWRARSAATFGEYCVKRRIAQYDRCPCGSGDKVKFC
jgi:SIR2-like domain